MAQHQATILIPDISGFTEFMTRTELAHGTKVINYLLDAIVGAVGDEYEVSEIEGDAVLLFRNGPAPAKKEILDICLKIFNAFHYQKAWMALHTLCPCNTCQAIVNLTLKFIVHHGPVAEMKVGRFVKLSGTDMIVAHRLMKNSIPSNEYMLLTEKLYAQLSDAPESFELEWNQLEDEFSSLGKVEYRFALLDEARKNTPAPPIPVTRYQADDTPAQQVDIAANYRDIYMVLMNIPGRKEWQQGLQKVEQDIPDVFIGSMHQCTFDNYIAILSPLRMMFTPDYILFAESCLISELGLSLVHEYTVTKRDDHHSTLNYRILNMGESPVDKEIYLTLNYRMKLKAEQLKTYCEAMPIPLFDAPVSV
jgi:class 3 adenylate cyclase